MTKHTRTQMQMQTIQIWKSVQNGGHTNYQNHINEN